MSRIAETFARLKADGRTGLVTYVTAGDPTLDHTAAVLPALARAGADVLEVGVPFSDPLADGPVIQRATERALASGTTLGRVIDMVAGVRADVAAPIVLFSYVNPLLRMGLARFAGRAREAGVDGVLVLDLPVEEADEARGLFDRAGLDTIFLLSPTTTDARMRRASEIGRGFLYVISRLGVTGARDEVSTGAAALAARVRSVTTLPLALGFGLSRPEHVQEVGRWADAAVVGSALVQVMASAGASARLVPAVEAYVAWLKGPAGAPLPDGLAEAGR